MLYNYFEFFSSEVTTSILLINYLIEDSLKF